MCTVQLREWRRKRTHQQWSLLLTKNQSSRTALVNVVENPTSWHLPDTHFWSISEDMDSTRGNRSSAYSATQSVFGARLCEHVRAAPQSGRSLRNMWRLRDNVIGTYRAIMTSKGNVNVEMKWKEEGNKWIDKKQQRRNKWSAPCDLCEICAKITLTETLRTIRG